MPPILILLDPSGGRRELKLAKVPFTIGRQAGNDLLLRDTRVSRQHAAIVADNGGYRVEDRGSRHGTYVNGVRIERHTLANNDRIEFGQQSAYALIYLTVESALPELLKRVETPVPAHVPARELRNLSLLLEVGRVLHAGLALEEILATVVDASLNLVGAERGFLLLKGESGELEFCLGRDREQHTLDAEAAINRSAIEELLRRRCDLVLTDSQADPRLLAQQSGVNHGLGSVVYLPLCRVTTVQATDTTIFDSAADVLGVLYFDVRKPVEAFSDVDRQILLALAMEASTVIENARLFTAARAKQRLDQELSIARAIQQALLPKGLKQCGFFHATGVTLPCEQVGGDYFDLTEFPDQSYGFVVADVSGKGVSAALLTSMLQGAFSATASLGQPPEGIARYVNRFFCERAEINRYATLVCGILQSDGKFAYVNAGHLPPLLIRRDGTLETLPAESFPIGLFLHADFPPGHARLGPGDTLVFYTDGFTEATNPAGEPFGLEQFERTVVVHAGLSVEEIRQSVLSDVIAFTGGSPQTDDMTLMIVRYQGRS